MINKTVYYQGLSDVLMEWEGEFESSAYGVYLLLTPEKGKRTQDGILIPWSRVKAIRYSGDWSGGSLADPLRLGRPAQTLSNG